MISYILLFLSYTTYTNVHDNNSTCDQLKSPFELWESVSFSCKRKMYEIDHRWHTHALRVHERELMDNCNKPLYTDVFYDLLDESKQIYEAMIILLTNIEC